MSRLTSTPNSAIRSIEQSRQLDAALMKQVTDYYSVFDSYYSLKPDGWIGGTSHEKRERGEAANATPPRSSRLIFL